MSGRKRTREESEGDRDRVYQAFVTRGTEQGAAEEAGVPRSTARRWLLSPEGKAAVATLQAGLHGAPYADKLRSVASIYLESLRADAENPERMAKMQPRDKAIILGILLDKAKALEGPAPETEKRFKVKLVFGGRRVKEGEEEAFGGAVEVEG